LLITGSQFPAGRLLPPVRALATHLGVNQHTLRAAYQQLAGDGLIDAPSGRGTTVLAMTPSAWRRPLPVCPHSLWG